ncbi:MAG TPA: flippase activity-associated protein Agl23, partial [Anaerolineales bacterium]|nr:flippase activity-associated protein Agl23 [Anaerolineales bacterium]
MENRTQPWLERPIHPALPAITNEIAIFAGIILLAIITRFYDLGTRVMSHDESLHTYFSWLLYRGQGYQHTPMMHGPWQFHLIALSYFLFGASDFTARIPAALFSIATIWMTWYWRRYLGTWGAIIAALMMVISPYMLFYGRYVREDVYAGFSGVLLLYSILRYFESGRSKYLFLVTIALIIHFLDKESSFIYAFQAFLFLAIYFIARVTRRPWEDNSGLYRAFIIALAVAVVFVAIGGGIALANRHTETLQSGETAAPVNPEEGAAPVEVQSDSPSGATILIGLAVVALAAAAFFLLRGLGWERIRQERSFDLMILIGTLVMPMAIPFPIKWLESRLHVAIPTDSASVASLTQRDFLYMGVFIGVFFAISIAVGMFWNRDWWKYAALFWGAFTIFYTTVFTNGPGFFTGLLGSLGYWLVQQGVERGSQPEYYYVLVQIPIYEFLPAIGSIVAIAIGLTKLFGQRQAEPEEDVEIESRSESDAESNAESRDESIFGLFFGQAVWWVFTSILAFTIAGERMPWLTYHMAWPMILLAGWGIGQIIESVLPQLAENRLQQNALAILVLVVFVLAAFNTVRSLFGATPPFQGTELSQLQATSAFLFPLITAILSGALLAYLM